MEVRMALQTARDIMTPDPVTVTRELPVTEAAHIMTEKRVGALPVLDGAGKLIGLVTEGDLIMQDAKVHFPTYLHLLGGFVFYPGSTERFESDLKKAVGATVEDVMTVDPVTVAPDATVEDVATLLVQQEVSRLPVMDGDALVGIISKSDIVRAIAAEK
jgi:CBS domain-containing protein